MARKKVKQRLSSAERARRSRQARINFGFVKKHARRMTRSRPRTHRRIGIMPRRHHRRHGRSSRGLGGMFGGVNVMNIALMGVGAGLAGVAGQQVSKYAGGRLNGNAAQAVAGVGLLLVGKKTGLGKYTTPIATGILVKTVGDFVEDNVAPRLMGASAAAGASTTEATFA